MAEVGALDLPRVSRTADRMAAVVVWGVALAVAGVLGWILWSIARGAFVHAGGSGVGWFEFLTAPPIDLGLLGGIGPVLVSTGVVLGVCLGVAVPLGLGTAVLLTESAAASGDARLVRLVRRSLDVLAGVPSIVFGLFGAVLFGELLGMGFSLLAGGLTLACMVLPIFTRAAEDALRAVPAAWRQGGAGLGLGRYGTLRRVVLPAALPGIAAGLVLGVGRALAETAALLFTAGEVLRMPEGLGDSGRVLSVHVYNLSMNVNGGDAAAYRSALVLVVLLVLINLAASVVSRRYARRLKTL